MQAAALQPIERNPYLTHILIVLSFPPKDQIIIVMLSGHMKETDYNVANLSFLALEKLVSNELLFCFATHPCELN